MRNLAKYQIRAFASSLFLVVVGFTAPAKCAEAIMIGAVSTITGAFTFPIGRCGEGGF